MAPRLISGLTVVIGLGTRIALLFNELIMSEIFFELVIISGL